MELERGDEMQLWVSSGRKIDVFLYTEADYDAASKRSGWSPGTALQHHLATTSMRLAFKASKTGWFYLVFVALRRGALVKITLTFVPGPPRKRSISEQLVRVVPLRRGSSLHRFAQNVG